MPSLPPPPALRQALPDGAVLIAGPNLRIRVSVLSPGVVLVTARGEVKHPDDVSAEAALLRELEAELERAGGLNLFADLRESERMPSTSRERISNWARRHEKRALHSNVLVRSSLLEMAMSIVSMLVGTDRVVIHIRIAAFLAALQKAAPGLTELPRAPE